MGRRNNTIGARAFLSLAPLIVKAYNEAGFVEAVGLYEARGKAFQIAYHARIKYYKER